MTSEPAEHDPFFEPGPASKDQAPIRRHEMQPWEGPSPLEAGVFLAAGQTLARSAKAVVFLPVIRVFSTGCLLDVEIVSRPSAWPEDDPWDMQLALHRSFRGFRGSRLPDVVLRLGVRFPDGRKATTVEGRRPGRRDAAPDGPLLSWWPTGSGTRGGGELGFSRFGMWLWPLPPAESFELAAEWPAANLELSFTQFDGAAIVAAAARPTYYWPEDQPAVSGSLPVPPSR
jgi:hypothetical protein